MTTESNKTRIIAGIMFFLWVLALVFTARQASAETKMWDQDTTAGWYETEDPLPMVKMVKNKHMSKITGHSNQSKMTQESEIAYSWYETEDPLPFPEQHNWENMKQKSYSLQQEDINKGQDLLSFWYETEDPLPAIN